LLNILELKELRELKELKTIDFSLVISLRSGITEQLSRAIE